MASNGNGNGASTMMMDSNSEDDMPLSHKVHVKKESAYNSDSEAEQANNNRQAGSDSEDDAFLDTKQPVTKRTASDEDSDDAPLQKKVKREPASSHGSESKEERRRRKKEKKRREKEAAVAPPIKSSKPPAASKAKAAAGSPTKGRAAGKATEDEPQVWRWWEEEKRADGIRWRSLQHNGPYFAPAYDPLPKHVRFYYDGKPMKLSLEAEEVATFYAKMLDHEYTSKEAFNKNYFGDWRKVMNNDEKKVITSLSKCNFRELHDHFAKESEERKNRSKEEKKQLKDKNEELVKEYGWCHMDGHKQRIANFRIEPPGLFRGRGNHPKMGMLKGRTRPEDIIINCGKDSNPPKAPAGHRWKEIRHDNKVTWLACWIENVQGNFKYVMLNASSRLKGEKDWTKYETARRLHLQVDSIRRNYQADFKSKEMKRRQRAVALYFIDKLALRAGNEKDEDEADTVGCCSLRVEHIKLHAKHANGQECVVEFDFLGKDSIRYQNAVAVEKRVFKNVKLFMENKKGGDDLFDRINTTILNQHLKDLMPGLTAKVFRTYNASRTLEEQLNQLTQAADTIPAKVLAYNRANRSVAVLCNHQRAVPKTFDKSMEALDNKIEDKRQVVAKAKKEAKKAKAHYKVHRRDPKAKSGYEQKKKAYTRLEEQLVKLELQRTDKDENKDIALGTSKLNYLDPRITVAWAKKWEVPIEKLYSKTQREKFQWALDMATKDFVFLGGTDDIKKVENENEDEDDDEEEEDDE